MAYTFPTTKDNRRRKVSDVLFRTKDNRRRKVSDVLFRNLPLIQVRNQHSAAVESGNWGMMIYYKFLYHLLEASLPDYPQRVPEHLHKMAFAEPVDALTGLKTANTILTMLKDLPKSSTPLRQLSSLSLFLENNLADWYLLITFATILNNLKQQRLWNYLLDFGLERK